MPHFRRKEQQAYLPDSLYGTRPDTLPASPHRTGHSSGLHPEDTPYLTAERIPQSTLRLPAPVDVPTMGDDPPTEVRVTHSTCMTGPTRAHVAPVPVPVSPAVPVRSPQVYTLGYSQPGARLVADTLIWHEGWLLLDIRRTLVSTWADWTQRTLLQRYGSAYVHVPEFGNLNYRDHRLPILLADAPGGVRQVIHALDQGRRCLLLCACKDYRTCHRDIVARLLQQVGVPVTHLITQSLPPEQVRVGHARDGVALSLLLTGSQLQMAATCGLLTLTRTQSMTVPVDERRQSLSVQVSLTAWPSTVDRRPSTAQEEGGSR